MKKYKVPVNHVWVDDLESEHYMTHHNMESLDIDSVIMLVEETNDWGFDINEGYQTLFHRFIDFKGHK